MASDTQFSAFEQHRQIWLARKIAITFLNANSQFSKLLFFVLLLERRLPALSPIRANRSARCTAAAAATAAAAVAAAAATNDDDGGDNK